MKKEGISTATIAATYIGTIVGAGFATGQEVLQFFSAFGIKGLLGLLVTTFLFSLFGYMIIDLGKELHVTSHLEIIQYSGGKILGGIIDFIITFFLFGALTAMIAGTGALFKEQFNLPSLMGNILMAILTALTVLTGINGVIHSISFVVPFLLVAVMGTSLFAIFTGSPDIYAVAEKASEGGLVTHWLLSAILYVSYNTIISIAVLGPLGTKARNKKSIQRGAILGGLGLGIGSIMIYFALSGNLELVQTLEVPMIYIAGKISYSIQLLYAGVLIAEVYTTAVGALYGFATRITPIENKSSKSRKVILGATLLALIASQFGFSNLVKYLYPIVGYGGILLLLSLLYSKYKEKSLRKWDSIKNKGGTK